MAKRQKQSKTVDSLPVIRPDTAGMDIGAEQIHVAVGADRDARPIRTFGTFTRDLVSIADWLIAIGVTSVAMESTGVYWIPPYQYLESRGLEVLLVNAHHIKNVPGRKSDVADAAWIQLLHAVGLLRGSFRPNVQMHHVISDMTGATGMRILQAIVGGQRDGARLATLCDPGIRASREVVIQSL